MSKSSCRCLDAGDVPRKVFWCILPTYWLEAKLKSRMMGDGA